MTLLVTMMVMYGYANRAVMVHMDTYQVVTVAMANDLIIGENLANKLDNKSLINYNIIVNLNDRR